MKRNRWPFVVLAVFFMTGCSQAVDVSQDYDQSAPFSEYRTYAWAHRAGSDESAPAEYETLDTQIRATLEKNLVAKGLQPDMGDPDVLVGYRLSITKNYTASMWGIDHESLEGRNLYEDGGILVVDMIDAKTKERVWRGTALGALNVDPTPEMVERNLNNVMTKLLAQYPPGQGGQRSK